MVTEETTVQLIFSRPVMLMAVKVSIVVGSLLVLINHGPALLNNSLSAANLWQIALTYLVPYSVSTYSSVSTLKQQ